MKTLADERASLRERYEFYDELDAENLRESQCVLARLRATSDEEERARLRREHDRLIAEGHTLNAQVGRLHNLLYGGWDQ